MSMEKLFLSISCSVHEDDKDTDFCPSNPRYLHQNLEDVQVGAQSYRRQHAHGQSWAQHSQVMFIKKTIFKESVEP